MPKALNLTNQTFGKLTAIERAPSRGGKTYWVCKCECGTIKEVQTSHLTNKTIQSCGCKSSGQKVIDFRVRIKKALVEANGHKCACCGLVDDYVVYDFHHLNPETKSFGIGNNSTTRSKQAYGDEAKKCVMLCSNCHRKVEKGLINQELEIVFDEDKYYQVLEELVK